MTDYTNPADTAPKATRSPGSVPGEVGLTRCSARRSKQLILRPVRTLVLAFSLFIAAASIMPADVIYTFDASAVPEVHVPEVTLSFVVPSLITAQANITSGIVSAGVWGTAITDVTISPGLNNTNPFVSFHSPAVTETAYFEDNPWYDVLGTHINPQIFDHFGQYTDASGDVLTIAAVNNAATPEPRLSAPLRYSGPCFFSRIDCAGNSTVGRVLPRR